MPKLFGFDAVSLPGPRPSRLLWHLPALFRFFDDPVATLERLRSYGDVVALVRDNPAVVSVFGEERNREVLTNLRGFPHVEDFVPGRPGSPMSKMGSSIIVTNGDLHKRCHRLMMPAFSKSALAGYADDELVPDAMTLFFAGHDTMAKTLSWTMFLLARHPQVLEDVLDELDDVVGERRVRGDEMMCLGCRCWIG